MISRSCVFFVICLVAAGPAAGQKNWVPSRTPDGQPDMQGTWTGFTLTPFERSPALGGRAFFTEAEVAEIEKRGAQTRDQNIARPGDVGTDTWGEPGTKISATRQTSLVVDPPDGRVPLTREAEEQHAFQLAHNADSWEYMSLWDRCVTRGVPGGMLPANTSNAYQIIQTPGYVVIVYEMIHEAHIVPLVTEHIQAGVNQLNGDSIGRWEGNALVVDTTNYNGHGQIATSAYEGRMKAMHETTAMHVVERFTRVSADTISYEVTIEDAGVYSRPWKVSMPLDRDDSFRMFEYACHEGNEAVTLTLRGGRAADQAAAKSSR